MVTSHTLFQLVAALVAIGSTTAAPAPSELDLLESTGILASLPYKLSVGAPTYSDQTLNITTGPLLNRRAESVDYQDGQAPNELLLVKVASADPVLAGVREQNYDYTPTQICTPTRFDLKAEYPIYMSCIHFKKKLVWDIRRIGPKPLVCDGPSRTTQTTILSHSERQTLGVNVELEASYEFISVKMGFKSEHEVIDKKETKTVVECGDTHGKSCWVGGRAIIEMNMMEGWVKPLTGWVQDQSHPWGQRPEWPDMGDEKEFGMKDRGFYSHWMLNANDHPNTWDQWPATNGSCSVNGNKFHNAVQDSKQPSPLLA